MSPCIGRHTVFCHTAVIKVQDKSLIVMFTFIGGGSYLPSGLPWAIGTDKLHKFLQGILSRVVVIADGWVGEVGARLLDDGGRREVQGRGWSTGAPCKHRRLVLEETRAEEERDTNRWVSKHSYRWERRTEQPPNDSKNITSQLETIKLKSGFKMKGTRFF